MPDLEYDIKVYVIIKMKCKNLQYDSEKNIIFSLKFCWNELKLCNKVIEIFAKIIVFSEVMSVSH